MTSHETLSTEAPHSPDPIATGAAPWAGGRVGAEGPPLRRATDFQSGRPRPGSVPANAPKAAPLPKRPKGRLFVGAVLLSLLGGIAFLVWDAYFRYQAYGLVEGRIVKVAAPYAGIVRSVFVVDGQTVEQGELLFAVENLEARQQLDRLKDDLRVAQVDVASEISQIQLKTVLQDDRRLKALAEYYELWGTLLFEQGRLDEAELRLARADRLNREATIPAAEYEAARFSYRGQKDKVARLTEAVAKLKDRTQISDAEKQVLEAQVRPKIVRLETLQNEISRATQRIELGKVRSPVAGRVLRSKRFAGEYTDATEPTVEIVEAGSLRVVLYVPADAAARYRAGQEWNVAAPARATTLRCTVTRCGEQFVPAPDCLIRYFRKGQNLLAIYLTPAADDDSRLPLLLGAEVRIPRVTAAP